MAKGKLSELSDWEIAEKEKDVRGRAVIDMAGSRLGTIRDMIIDTDRERVESVVLDNGQQYPVEALDLRGSDVMLCGAGSTGRPALGGGVLVWSRITRRNPSISS